MATFQPVSGSSFSPYCTLAAKSVLPPRSYRGIIECKCPLGSLPAAYTKSPGSFCTRGSAWKCFSRWVLQFPAPKLLSVTYQFSCCSVLPCSMQLFPGCAVPSPSGARSTATKGPRARVGTHRPAGTLTLAVLAEWERW